MKLIDRKIHGYLDYIVGILLIAAPWLLDFDRGGAETWVPVILGAGTIIYSMLTDYELGILPKIPFGTHLVLDVINGIILASSPWLFNFNDYVFLPHLIVGILEIGVAALTKTVSNKTSRRSDRRRLATH